MRENIFFSKIVVRTQRAPKRHLNAARQKLPRRNFCRSLAHAMTQGAAEGGRQKEFDHFFSFSGLFRSLFGHFF